MLKFELEFTVVAVLAGLGWLENRLRHQNVLKQLAIIWPFEMLKVKMEWTFVAVLAALGWLDKVHQLTPKNYPRNLR